MAINWNREITGKDVKKFFNQEIKLGEINYSKCMQVSLLIFALGIVPAFTYGMVLGVLDEQRVALMGEVSALKAQVISSTSTLPRAATLYNATTDKTVYTLGSTTLVNFYNSYPASTTNIVSIDLYSSSTLVQRIASMSPRTGLNQVSFKVASSSLEKTNMFHVRVTATKYNQFAETNRFVVNKPLATTSVALVYTNTQILNNELNPNSSAEFTISFSVTSPVDTYMRRNVLVGTTTNSVPGLKTFTREISSRTTNAKDNSDSYFLRAGETRTFIFETVASPLTTGPVGITLKGILFGAGAYGNASDRVINLDTNIFRTQIVVLQAAQQPAPKVSFIKTTQEYVSNISDSSSDDQGRFGIQVAVTAVVDTYIKADPKNVLWRADVLRGDSRVSTTSTFTSVGTTSPKDVAGLYFVRAGTTREFKLDAFVNPLATSLIQAELTGVVWGTTPTETNVLKFTNPFETAALWVLN